MNNLFYYFLYLTYLIMITFLTFILISVNNFNIFISILVLLSTILIFTDLNNFTYINGFFKLKLKNEKNLEIINGEVRKSNANFKYILTIKQTALLLLFLLLFYFNLVSILLLILVFDFLVKITFDDSLIEFYYNRTISLND